MLSRFQSGRAFVSCVLKDIYLVRNLEHLRRTFDVFEKKNSKRARVKKKEKKEKKTRLFFSSSAGKKKICFIHTTHRLTDIKSNSSSSFIRRTKENTHIYIFIIIIYK